MNISLQGTSIAITPSLRRYVDEKIVRTVEKLLGRSADPVKVAIELERTTRHHRHGKIFRAEANVSMGKKLLRAEATGEDLHEAIDLVEYEISREIRRFKNKRRDLERKGARHIKSALRRGKARR